ncbi:unnamed protein product [Merluccius merluccius]
MEVEDMFMMHIIAHQLAPEPGGPWILAGPGADCDVNGCQAPDQWVLSGALIQKYLTQYPFSGSSRPSGPLAFLLSRLLRLAACGPDLRHTFI